MDNVDGILVVGLGNVGSGYAMNKHNIGFWLIDFLLDEYQIPDGNNNKLQASVGVGKLWDHRVIFSKPNNYMNNSGVAVSLLRNFYKIPSKNIIVCHDDLDLQLGDVRVKIGGGSGGHNGIKSIDSMIGKDYLRVRMGISHPGHKGQVSDYVLSNFAADDEVKMRDVIIKIAKNFEFLIRGDVTDFRQKMS